MSTQDSSLLSLSGNCQEAERPQSSLPILPLFAAEAPGADDGGRPAGAPDPARGGKDGALPHFRLDGGLTAPQSTPEEISARTGHDMGAPCTCASPAATRSRISPGQPAVARASCMLRCRATDSISCHQSVKDESISDGL